jgi:hypothetical protein
MEPALEESLVEACLKMSPDLALLAQLGLGLIQSLP